MNTELPNAVTGVILEENQYFSLSELCQTASLPAEQLLEMVAHGIIEPVNQAQTVTLWQFSGNTITRIHTAQRLQHDLDVNLAGAALAIELLEEIKSLRRSLARLPDE